MTWILPAVSEADHKGRTSFFANRKYPNYHTAIDVFDALRVYKTSDHKPVEEIKMMSPDQIKEFNYRTMIRIVGEKRKRLDD